MRSIMVMGLAAAMLAAPMTGNAQYTAPVGVGKSEVGPDDELGRLSWMTDASRSAVMAKATGKVYDLATDYFIGMPSFNGLGDPPYQYWLTHTPRGTAVDDPAKVGRTQNETVSYTSDAVSFFTHMGTHIDALNHFGLHGKIWNGFDADTHLGDRGWKKTGAETIPPIVARGVLIDVAGAERIMMAKALIQKRHRSLFVPDGAVFKAAATLIKS